MPSESTPCLYRRTYPFEDFPSSNAAYTWRGLEVPIYRLGWLILLPYFFFRTRPESLFSYRENVLKPKWQKLGYATDENIKDGVSVPEVNVFGLDYLFITIAVSSRTTVDALKRPEVRDRVLRQAWSMFDLDPKYATADKLKWFSYPAPRNIAKLPGMYPIIYSEGGGGGDTLPDFVEEVIMETWMEKIKSSPGPSRIQIEEQEESEKK